MGCRHETCLLVFIRLFLASAAAAELLQSCLTLCDPEDSSPPGSSVRGIFQARILEWIDVPSSKGSSQPRDQTWVSYIACIADIYIIFFFFNAEPSGKPECLTGSYIIDHRKWVIGGSLIFTCHLLSTCYRVVFCWMLSLAKISLPLHIS